MNIVLLGAPGAGKGTQAELICKTLNIPRISSGDILRANIKNGTHLGQVAQEIMARGELLADDIIVNLMLERIKEPDCLGGFLLDGFPRTLGQAHLLDEKKINIQLVVEILVPDAIIIERLKGRLVHLASGRSYHIKFNPPIHPGLDDLTQEKLVARKDDDSVIVQARLALYHQETVPVSHYYKQKMKKGQYYSFSGDQDKDSLFKQLIAFIYHHR